jgi:hypothetical protein
VLEAVFILLESPSSSTRIFISSPFTPLFSGSPYQSFNRTPRRFWAEAVNIACYVLNRIYLRVHKKKTCFELMHGRTPNVSHFHVFGCKCFILKKWKKLDKFEARSVDGIFFGYASHSRAYRVPNLETNQIMETCEVTFDETQSRSQVVFEYVGDDELGEEIFQEEEHEHGDDEDGGVVPMAENVPTTSTMVMDGPSPTPTTTNQDQGEATIEGGVSIKARTSPASTSASPSFKDHRRHE